MSTSDYPPESPWQARVPPDSLSGNCIAMYDIDTERTWFTARERLDLPPADDDRWLRPKMGETAEQLAYRAWGWRFGDRATRLAHVIRDIAGITNPFLPLETGRRLRILSTDRIVLEILP